ncbi:LysR substrate-binding domain-containing protein [Roseovarius sp. CAU 1744]|uniref:LysR substrate-binding domain-containing protein n=1 Tax=Roseovarius sp. CAU 1744 TaxID=3140368 RepID=UPI00325A9F73
MRNSLKLLSSPRNLFVFEAAARLGSFTRAAEELGMQQPSVSAAIKQLESSLGVILFERGHRKVSLTHAGMRFFTDVSRALHEIETSAEAVHKMGRKEHVTLNSSSGFSYYWMIPRLHLLREQHPDVDLRLQNSDHEPDIDAENISLAIRLGSGNWPGVHSALIAEEVIFPVASPEVMAAAKNLRSIPNLLNERLIHLEEPVRQRPTWSQWFAHHGIRDRDIVAGLRLNDYALVLQAALSGQGFAFGWQHVVQGLVDRKTLAARTEWAWKTGNGIYLIWSRTKPLSHPATLVRDWIISVSDFPDGP